MDKAQKSDKRKRFEKQLAELRQQLHAQQIEHAAQIEALQQRHAAEMQRIFDSSSWRLTAPLRLASVQMRRGKGLIQRIKPLPLLPISGIAAETDGLWRSTDHDPQFQVQLPGYCIGTGWYQFRIHIDNPDDYCHFDPVLFVSYGNGYSPEHQFHMHPAGEDFECLVRFDQPPVALRLDALEEAGIRFGLQGIRIRSWSRPQMALRLVKDIYTREREKGQSRTAIAKRILSGLRRYGPLHVARNLHSIPALSAPRHSSQVSYAQWIREVEKPFLDHLQQQAENHRQPGAFIVFPAASQSSALDAALHSIATQNLPHWRAWVFCHAQEPLPAPYADDERFIRLELEDKQALERIAADTNSPMITLLRRDCQLAPHYLLALNHHLANTAAVDACYSDHDEIHADALRRNPRFKPDWCPDYFLEYDYVGPVCAFSPKLLSHVSTAYHQSWHLLCRIATAQIRANVTHLPYVCWHQSEAFVSGYRPEQQQYLQTLLQNERVEVQVVTEDHLQLDYTLPEIAPTVEIIIPTRDQPALLRNCISSLLQKTRYRNFHITVVDNQSSDPSALDYLESLQNQPGISVVRYDHPFNYSAINNYVALQSDSDLLCFLNNDIEIIEPDWLDTMVAQASRKAIGAVGAKLLYDNHRIQHAGVIVGFNGVAGHAFTGFADDDPGPMQRLACNQNYSAVTAACLMVKTPIFQELGGFNEKQLAVAFNDTDLCLRIAEKGYRNLWCARVRLIHHESMSRPPETSRMDDFAQEIRYMHLRWKDRIQHDPAYNPHLSMEGEPFQLSLRQQHAFDHSHGVPGRINPVQHPYAFEDNEQRIATILRDDNRSGQCRQEYSPGLSIVILTLEKPELIGPLLDDLVQAQQQLADTLPLQIIVGDTGSERREVLDIYRRHAARITLVQGLRYHFSRCNNDLFIHQVKHETTLFLNNDIIFDNAADALLKMYQTRQEKGPDSIVGTYLLYPDGRLQHGGVSVIESGELAGLCYHPHHGEAFSPLPDDHVQVYPAVTGACLMIPSQLFVRCGLFDENFAAEAQDIDLCFKAVRLGGRCYMRYAGKIQHLENATRKKGEAHDKDRARFVRKWAGFYQAVLK